MWFRQSVLVVTLFFDLLDISATGIAGPYTFKLREGNHCRRDEVGDFGDDFVMDAKFFHRPGVADAMLDINLTYKNDIGARGATSVKLDVAKWDPVGGWKQHFMQLDLGEACFLMENIGPDGVKEAQRFFPGFPSKCPVPNTTYYAYNVSSRAGALRRFPTLPYGRYRIHTFMHHLKKKSSMPRACYQYEMDVVEKVIRRAPRN